MNALSGGTVVVIGGSSGIGSETARQAHAADAKIVLTGRDQGRLDAARDELGASAASLGLGDTAGLHRFFAELTGPVDHVLVAGDGPVYAAIVDMDFDLARSVLDAHLLGSLRIAAASLPVIAADAALEIAPVRVNAIAAGFVDTPLSARLLGDELAHRREQLCATLPIRRVVGPSDVAALALHLMANTALTRATYGIDGSQRLIP